MLHPEAPRSSAPTGSSIAGRAGGRHRQESDERLAVVTLYEYENNTTTSRLVDLNSGTIVNEKIGCKTARPLTNVEAICPGTADERRSDPSADRAVQGRETLPIPAAITDPDSPLYGRRVVRG